MKLLLGHSSSEFRYHIVSALVLASTRSRGSRFWLCNIPRQRLLLARTRMIFICGLIVDYRKPPGKGEPSKMFSGGFQGWPFLYLSGRKRKTPESR